MSNTITIIRIDPNGRKIAAMLFKCGKNAVPEVRRVLRAVKVGHYQAAVIGKPEAEGGIPLMVAGGLDMPDEAPAWRLRGAQDTAGIGMLFGKGPNGGMIDVPVDVAWVEREIVWIEPNPNDGAPE
jgi:hypothetical protein